MTSEDPKAAGQGASTETNSTACWRIADVIDFEYFLDQDGREPIVRLEQRDHQIYRDAIFPRRKGEEVIRDRRWLFLRWLEERRQTLPASELCPGELAASAWSAFLRILGFAGIVLGAGFAARLLQYDGIHPVNVAAYLGWLVLAQIALVAGAGVILMARRAGMLASERTLLLSAVRSLWSRLAAWTHRHALSRVPADRRTQVQAFLGMTAGRQSLYGQAALWPLAGAMQLFGVLFNVGALATTLALVIFSDRAFGWQSAIHFSPEQVERFVHSLAWPWQSWWPEAGAPTLDQIQGSRIILKDGIKQLATEDLVSWWPFLCLCLVTYGLVPRLILWGLAAALGKQALRSLAFNHVACDRLYERLTAPALQTSGAGPEAARTNLPDEPVERADPRTTTTVRDVPATAALAFVHEDLLGEFDQSQFARQIEDRFHLQIHELVAWPAKVSRRGQALSRALAFRWQDGTPKVIWLEEAWQPPIAEKLNALRALRKSAGDSAKILVVLIGRPEGSRRWTLVKASEWKVWERQIAALGDPGLRLEPLLRHE